MASAKSVIRALKKYANAEPDLIDLLLSREVMRRDRSDRSVAIMIAIEVEQATLRALLRWFRPLKQPEEYDGLFGVNAPLSSFSARIRVLYALRIIGERTRDDLDIIRTIRNSFAHCGKSLTFETEEVKNACLTLHAANAAFVVPGLVPRKKRHESAPRIRYLTAARNIIFYLQGLDMPDEYSGGLP